MTSQQDDQTRLATDIATRLRRACAHLSPPEFAELVEDVTRMTERFAEIDADPRFWTPATSSDATVAPLPSPSGTLDPPPPPDCRPVFRR